MLGQQAIFNWLSPTDMIAVPDFAAGAMENWGLITYRETAMLYDPQESSESNKQRVAVVVSHELAHQVGKNKIATGNDYCNTVQYYICVFYVAF